MENEKNKKDKVVQIEKGYDNGSLIVLYESGEVWQYISTFSNKVFQWIWVKVELPK